ncbi:MAG: PEGA domain-containing protein [Bacteroidaceae bacterium]
MKKLILLLALFGMLKASAQAPLKTQLELLSFEESLSEGGMSNLAGIFKGKDWPTDVNDDKPCAWVRVTFQNMSLADARNVKFDFGASAPIKTIEDHLDEEIREVWLWVTPSDYATMEASLSKYGASNRLYDLKLKPKSVYDVVLKNNKTMSISVDTQPQGATVVMETGEKAVTPATFTDVALGQHTLTISLNGQTKLQEAILVSEENVKFTYDIRDKKKIRFSSDPADATLYIDGEMKGYTPCSLELPYGSYQVEARLGIGETDVKSITIGDLSADEIKLEPIKKKTFEVYAIYNGRKVDADLYIDGRSEGVGQSSYTLTKPIGKTYKMQMNYYGNSKKRTIKVRENMAVDQEFKISARNSFSWWWQKPYDATPGGFAVSYISKQFVTSGDGYQLKEDLWGRKDRRMHGMQMGLHFQPCFSFGLGLYTGLFYELYMSLNDDYDYNQFTEHSMYIPLHLFYRIPFSRKVALFIHGGVGMDCGLYARFKDTSDSNSEPYEDYYGEDGWPKRVNFSAEVGGGLRLGPIQLHADYSKGLNDHKFYSEYGNYKTIQKKLSIGISYVFGGD